MREIRSLDEAHAALLPYVPLVARLTGKDTTLDRIRPLMELLGDPQNHTRVVHIAGTSGKTSTAYFMAALLRASGKHVGLTVSPHVDSIAERVQLDGKPISEERFCKNLAEFLEIVEHAPEKPSYFELLYAFSFWVFKQANVDYAVIETGMGGLHDATNVAGRADKLCIITDIGYDHMHILGRTLEAIAAQKAGIVHNHNPVIMYEQDRSIVNVVKNWAHAHQATLMLATQITEQQTLGDEFSADMPDYQRRNWLLAYRAYKFLMDRDGLPPLSPVQLLATQSVQVPARMDARTVKGKVVIMDGAHNEQKMATFLASFGQMYPNIKPAVLLALKEGKDSSNLGSLFAPLASELIITTFNTSQDLPAKSTNPRELAEVFRRAGVQNVSAVPDQHEAYKKLLASSAKVCIITGSFYLLSQLRKKENLR